MWENVEKQLRKDKFDLREKKLTFLNYGFIF